MVTAEVHFPVNGSLKAKRMLLRSMRDHLKRQYGASFAEVGYQDLWQRSRIVYALAASDLQVLERTMQAARGYLDGQEWDLIEVREEVVEPDA